MEKFKRFIAALLCCLFCFSFFSCNRVYLKKENSEDLRETIDFIQLWYCRNFSTERWKAHIEKLKDAGYEGIILASTARFNENGIISLGGRVYAEWTVERLLSAAEEKDFDVYIGLANSSLWWDARNYAENSALWGEYEAIVAQSIAEKVTESKAFKGFYMPLEAYSNDKGYEKLWAQTYNAVISKLNEVAPDYPLIFSPYRSKLYRMSKGELYSMAEDFLSLINLRSYDVIAPQDGFGGLSAEYDERSAREVEEFLSAFYTAAQEVDKCEFGVNLEFFTDKEKVYASEERIAEQREMANDYASIILSFSYSHYFAR